MILQVESPTKKINIEEKSFCVKYEIPIPREVPIKEQAFIWEEDFIVISAKFSARLKFLWIAALEAEFEIQHMFLPMFETDASKRK